MRKTFKSVCVPGLELNISPSYQGIALTVTMDGELYESQGVTLSAEDAASLMLAIAEAGGGRDSLGVDVGNAMIHLHDYVTEQERITAEAKEQAKEQAELEAEALELFRAAFPRLVEEHFLSTEQAELWIRVARRALEKRATK